MAGEWLTTSFQSLMDQGVLEIGDGFRAKLEQLGGDGPMFLRAGHVSDDRISFEGVERFRREYEITVQSKTSRPRDVVVTTKGNSTGRTSFVREDFPRFVYSPHLSYWRSLKEEVLDADFLRYWAQSTEFRSQLAGMSASTDMAPYLSLVDQRRLQITLPPPALQKWCGQLLRGLDDKIELNRRMNETLESIARALFKSWFVDFDPVRARNDRQDTRLPSRLARLFPDQFQDSESRQIPRGWSISDIGKVSEVIDCLHSKKPDRQSEGKPFLQLWNIRTDALIDMSDTYFISEADYRMWITRIEASPGDCVITNVGRVGAVGQIPKGLKAALGRNMTGVRCRKEYPFPTFLLQALTSDVMRNEIELRTDSGTILDALNVRNIPKLRIVLPSKELMAEFERLARPLRARMEANQAESNALVQMRNTLLPKLISGELRAPNAERIVAVQV